MSASGKRQFKTLRQTPLARTVQAEIAASRRPAESAKATDRHIRSGLHPLAAAEANRQGVKPTRRRKAS